MSFNSSTNTISFNNGSILYNTTKQYFLLVVDNSYIKPSLYWQHRMFLKFFGKH